MRKKRFLFHPSNDLNMAARNMPDGSLKRNPSRKWLGGLLAFVHFRVALVDLLFTSKASVVPSVWQENKQTSLVACLFARLPLTKSHALSEASH